MNANKTILATLFAAAFAAPLAVAPAHAQVERYDQQQQQPANHYYSQAELDQMLAPIALYPDALLSQVLMAATYPAEVAEAARWTRSYPGLPGDDAVRAVENQNWDPSVKSLVAFPQILQRMEEQPGWTQTLGDAFLDQEPAVMDTVQQLRRRAQAAGNLRSDEQIRVVQQGPAIIVQPASPEFVYVPYYDPLVVYGPWWWPAYRPVAWAPWPGYARPYRPGVSAGFWWGRPVGLSANFFYGGMDWRDRQVRVGRNGWQHWQHDSSHRRGIAYRTPEARQNFAGPRVAPRDFRASSQVAPAAERARPQFQRQIQAQPQAQFRQQPQPQAMPQARPQPQQRAAFEERRAQPRFEHREARPPVQRQAQPPVQRQAEQPRPQQAQPRHEQRQERQEQRGERREAREQHGERGRGS